MRAVRATELGFIEGAVSVHQAPDLREEAALTNVNTWQFPEYWKASEYFYGSRCLWIVAVPQILAPAEYCFAG